MQTLEIVKIEKTKTKTIISWARLDTEKPDWGTAGKWQAIGDLNQDEVLEYAKTKVNEGIEVSINLGEKIPSDLQEGLDIPNVPEPTVPEVKTYLGKKIIAEKTSIINEKEYITLTLEDGSTCQLSEGEYNEGVK